MDEKGKNLATKEDIEEITRKTEEVQQEFRQGFELFSNDVKFKYIQSSKEIIARKKKSIKHLSGRDVEMLELVSNEAGKMEMLPWLGVAAVGASLLTAATIKVVDYFKSRKKNNETEIEKAKAEIINGIKEYDAAHPDEKGGSEDE